MKKIFFSKNLFKKIFPDKISWSKFFFLNLKKKFFPLDEGVETNFVAEKKFWKFFEMPFFFGKSQQKIFWLIESAEKNFFKLK